MTDFRKLSLRERLNRFPPFLCLALSRLPVPALTAEEKRARLWNRKVRAKRMRLRQNGAELPRRARKRRLTIDELIAFAGIGASVGRKMASSTSWDRFSVSEMLSFLEACEVDLLRMKEDHRFIRQGLATNKAFSHLTKQQMRRLVKVSKKWKQIT